MAMTFSDAGHHSPIEVTPEEMLAISKEISLKFSPNTASRYDNNGFPQENFTFCTDAQTNTDTEKTDFDSFDHFSNSFSPKELNEISREISLRFAPKASTAEPELFLLPVDPHHLYAYWDLGENKTHIPFEEDSPYRLTLRIYWRPDANPEMKKSNVWFDVSGINPDCRQKIRLPIDGSAYSAALGKLTFDNNLDVLATSNIIHVPPAPGSARVSQFQRNFGSPPPNPANIGPDNPKQACQNAREPFNEDAPNKSNVNDILYEIRKNGLLCPDTEWFVKLHFNNPLTCGGGISKIDSELLSIFNKKGINIELIPEPDFIDQTNIRSKNASGQGSY